MFSKDQFAFQSPNAIDAGELAPSPPSRTPRNDALAIREKAERILQDVENRAPQVAWQDESCWRVGFAEHGAETVKTSPNGALIYLQPRSYEIQSSQHKLIPEGGGHDKESTKSKPYGPSSRKGTTNEKYHGNLCRMLMSGVACLVVILIAIAVTYWTGYLDAMVISDGKEAEGSNSSDRLTSAIRFLSQEVSELEELSTEGTTQNRAVRWIADEDLLEYDIPVFSHDSDLHDRFVQRYVLAVLYFALGGDDWISDLGFLSSVDVCSWYNFSQTPEGGNEALGVICGGTDLHIKDVIISRNNLSGSLPTELSHLSQLEILKLDNNKITGSLPAMVRTMSKLQYLDLRHNRLRGEIPSAIGEMTNLKVLGLAKNQLSGRIPEMFQRLTNLITLDLAENFLHGNLTAVSALSNLRYLYVDSNELAQSIDDGFLIDLQKLRHIDISDNRFTSTYFPSLLLARPELSMLRLSRNYLNGTVPFAINVNFELEILALDDNKFYGTIPSSLHALVNLKHLDLAKNGFTGTLPPSLGEIKGLEYLSLNEVDLLPGDLPDFFSNLKHLKTLKMEECNLNGPVPLWLGNMTSLDFLDLRDNNMHGTLPEQVWNHPALVTVLLNGNNLYGSLPEDINRIETLGLHDNVNIFGNGDSLCNASQLLTVLTVDCDRMVCNSDCCKSCCQAEDQHACFDNQVSHAVENGEKIWGEIENKLRFESFRFSVLDDGQEEIVGGMK